MHCFEGVLVLLVPRNHSTDVINEILLSIEHVDLIRVYPDGAVDYTDTMPLFDIRMPPFSLQEPITLLPSSRPPERVGSRRQRGDRLRTNVLGAQGRV